MMAIAQRAGGELTAAATQGCFSGQTQEAAAD